MAVPRGQSQPSVVIGFDCLTGPKPAEATESGLSNLWGSTMAIHDLPTKEQIDAIDDIEALEDIRDELDQTIAKIETDLEYSGRDDEWYDRAKNALAYHKYVDTMLGRRLGFLRRKSRVPADMSRAALIARSRAKGHRRARWSAYTQAAFDGDIIDPELIADDLPALETALGVLLAQMNALKDDKDEEVLHNGQDEIDHEFLTRVGVVSRRCGAAHQVLLRRAAALRKEAKLANHAEHERGATRQQMFVDAAREVLDRETFLSIWEVVDRRLGASEAKAA